MENFDLRKYLAENRLLKENKIAQAIRDEAEQEDSKVGAAIFKRYAKKIESASKEDYRKILTSMERELIDTHPDTFDGDDDIVASFMALAENKLLKEELRDVEDILLKAGFRFDDGLLGGVGSGGAGYYDFTNDKIYGYNQEGPWNEEEFNKFYDNFKFNSNFYTREEMEKDLEIDTSIILDGLDDGIYAVGDEGYVEIRSDGDIEIYATPQLSDEEGREILPAFKMDAMGRAIPQYSKDEMRKILKDDMYYII